MLQSLREAGPTVLILRFTGDAEELLERFERARRLSSEGQDDPGDPPAFYAACRTQDGIAIVGGWQTDAAHKAFRRRIRPHLQAVGLGKPAHHEHMRIAKLGWD